ncbi:MAG: MFS transporter, partial [Vallitaleaceae bacterium]|nr:MFS transporter [Vallitaleaceae bacterium]
FPCALLYGVLAKKFTAKKMIIVAILTYIIAVFFAYFMTELWHVFVLGAIIGSAQGGIQALSRSYYARIIPKKNANEFFGFYNIFGKFAAILGPLLMAATTTITGVARYSILSIAPLFVFGLLIFLTLPSEVKINPETIE